MEREHKIKLIIKSKSLGEITVEEEQRNDKNETNIIKDISTSSGVTTFPTAKLKIKASPKYPNLINIKSSDEIQIFVNEIDKPFEKLFHGVILSVSVKSQKDDFQLLVESVSPFYYLQKRKLSQQNLKVTNGLREVLMEIVRLCAINGTVEVDDGIDNDFSMKSIKNFPALSIINMICYEKDLVYDFTSGDSIRFSKREDILNKMFSSIPIIIDKDKIISSEFTQ